VSDWPAITEPELLRRLALPDAAFREQMRGFLEAVGEREFTEAAYATALGYPWPRPPSSFALDGEDVRHLEAWDGDASAGRRPLLAFGSNGSPETLTRKFAHLPQEHRGLPVLAGDLHDFDVAAAGHPTAYGSFPATLFVSPGTALRAAVLWVTPEQLTALTWTEVSYRLGRLDGVRFEPDVAGAPDLDGVLAYASRWGVLEIDGHCAALAALPARERAAPAFTQEQLLGRLAGEVLGAGATARDLVEAVYRNFGTAAERLAPFLQANVRAFGSERWTVYPAAAP
jgi:hypothetical protein